MSVCVLSPQFIGLLLTALIKSAIALALLFLHVQFACSVRCAHVYRSRQRLQQAHMHLAQPLLHTHIIMMLTIYCHYRSSSHTAVDLNLQHYLCATMVLYMSSWCGGGGRRNI